MIRLLPSTDAQTFDCCPRWPERIYDLTLTITEELTGVSETIVPSAFDNGDTICIEAAFSILKENYTYFLTMTSDDEVWYRSKVFCTSQVGDVSNQNLREGDDDGFNEITKTSEYTILE